MIDAFKTNGSSPPDRSRRSGHSESPSHSLAEDLFAGAVVLVVVFAIVLFALDAADGDLVCHAKADPIFLDISPANGGMSTNQGGRDEGEAPEGEARE